MPRFFLPNHSELERTYDDKGLFAAFKEKIFGSLEEGKVFQLLKR
jgi:hypothetical protein